MAKINPTISTDDAGISKSAFLSRRGSPPAIPPMIRELTASPAHPQVMTNPIDVPGRLGKLLPAIARVAIDRYTQPGDLVVDPLCGIGTTLAVVC